MDIFGGAPRVLAYPRPLLVKSGEDAVLKCQIGGNPQPDVVWERKNESIIPEGRYCITQDGKIYTLHITQITAEDAGQYICRAKNSIGETYAAATLKVEEATEDLSCWQQPNQVTVIPPGQETKMVKQNSDLLAENEPFKSNKPHFLIKPLSLRVDCGEDAAFSCKLWGDPMPEMLWEKDGKQLNEIYESSHYHVSKQDGGWYQLKLFQTRVPDGGVYTCKAVNRHGEAMTGVVLLVETIPEQRTNGHISTHQSRMQHSKKPQSVSKAKKFTVTEGKHAKFRCFVTGKPKPEIVWKKNGEALVGSRRHLIFEDREGYYTLKLLYCKQQDAGLYICAASNTLGNTLSAVYLSVKGPPVQFRQSLQDVNANETGNAVLQCEVPEECIPTTWYLEDQRLQPGNKYIMEQKGTLRRLTIRNLEADDDGVYLCEMPDGGKTIAELAVKGTIVKKLPRRLEVMEGENAAFCVEVDKEETDIYWFKDGFQLCETQRTIIKSFGRTHILVFVQTSCQDSGTITFMSGRSRTSSKLKVKAFQHCPPICPVDLQIKTSSSDSVTLFWSPSPNLQTSTKFLYVLERQEVGSQEWQRFMTSETATSVDVLGDSVPCEGDYRFRICCMNKYGRSGHVEFPKVLHLVPGPKIKTGLSNVVVTSGEDAVFFIELSTDLIGTWFLNSQQLRDSESFSISHSKNQHILRIHQSQSVYDGCEITFIANGVRDSAVLQIKEAVVKFVPLPEMDTRKNIELDNPIVLYCEVSSPNATVNWFKDGQELREEPGLKIQSDGNMRRIVISYAQFTHSGVYTCQSNSDTLTFNVSVKAPPLSFKEISQQEREKSVMELDPVVLTCEISQPDQEVCWFKDGAELLPSDNMLVQAEGSMRRLIIRSADVKHGGVYTCQAHDSSVSFSVHVKELPVTIVDPQEDVQMEVHVCEEVLLSCEISQCDGEVSWFKDGLKLEESENIQLINEGPYRMVHIHSASRRDSGQYECETNSDSIFFQLIVTEAPVCIVSPSEPEVNVCLMSSEKLVLSCEVSRPDAPVCWYCDGMEVEKDDRVMLEDDGVYHRLVIPTATIDDSAEYVCKTADDYVTFWVKIDEPPVQISCSEQSGSVVKHLTGAPLSLVLEVSRENAEVCWMKDGVKLEENCNITIYEEGLSRKLTLHCPTLQDSGIYTCNAIDDTLDFIVKITEQPVNILKKDEIKKDHQVLLYDDIVLECELSTTKAEVTWYKNQNPITENERFCFEEEGTFRSIVILCAEMQDSGQYTLQAKDDMITFNVTVLEPAVKIIGSAGEADIQDLVTGEDLCLQCEVSRASAEVQWFCNDKLLVPDERTQIQSHGTIRKLVLSNITLSDSGKYICDASDDRMITVVKIQEPPVMFLNKEEVNVVTGYEAEAVTLTAMVSRSDAKVCWSKDWSPVSGERFHMNNHDLSCTFTIDPLKKLDSGEYTCSTNADEMHFSLLVRDMRVKFVKPLHDAVAHKDGMITLSCELCKAKADVQWKKDGVEITPGRRFSIRASGEERSLTVHRITKEDAGVYACESKDDCTSAQVRVELPRVVEFLTELHNTTVMEGEDAVFKCVVSPDDAQLIWLMDGEQIQPGARFDIQKNNLCHSLTIKKVQMLDSSRITAETEGVFSKASLKVQESQVMFTKRMEAVEAEEFGEATLETEVSLESGEVQWIRQGVVIQSGSRFKLVQNGCKRSLTISNLSLSDRGTYRCETLHDRAQVKLNVEPRKIVILQRLQDTETYERETASFVVELSHANVEAVWHKDGLRIKPSNSCLISCNGRVHGLTLSNLTLEDTGRIIFSAEGLKTTASLVIKEPPVVIIRKMSDVRTEEGSSITMECELSRPNMDVRWLKNGLELKSSKNLRIYSMGRQLCLQLLECSIGDSGLYTCEIGDLSTSASLQIYERELSVISDLEDLWIKEEQNAVFMCELSIQDMPGEWFKNGTRIRPSTSIKIHREGAKHFLLMCSMKAEDSGEIKFVSKQVESVAYLEVEELPLSIIRPLKDRTALEKHRVILECTVSSSNSAATWYKEDKVLESTDHIEMVQDGCCHKLIIHQVALDDEGSYSIEVGDHTSTAKLLVEGQSILVVKALDNVEVMCSKSASFHCELSVSLIKPPVWTLNGETLHKGSNVRVESQGSVHKLTIIRTSADMSGTVTFTLGKAKTSAKLTVIQ